MSRHHHLLCASLLFASENHARCGLRHVPKSLPRVYHPRCEKRQEVRCDSAIPIGRFGRARNCLPVEIEVPVLQSNPIRSWLQMYPPILFPQGTTDCNGIPSPRSSLQANFRSLGNSKRTFHMRNRCTIRRPNPSIDLQNFSSPK